MKQTLLGWLLLISLLAPLYGQQATVKGTVKDSKNGETLPGATILVDGKGVTSTSGDGKFEVSLTPGPHRITATYAGYENSSTTVNLKADEVKVIDLSLVSVSHELTTTVVTGSRYEKDVRLETVSIEVVGPELMNRTNSIDVAEVLNKVPGVNIVDGQASIRGGSGFAYGVGTRVSVLVDGLPLIAADQMNVDWQYLPLENVQQIEVIKGSSSVLYGSGSLNGIISVLTDWPKDKPSTTISPYSFIYSDPPRIETRWWNPYEQPFGTGLYFKHSRQIKTNADLVVGGNYHFERSYLENNGKLRGRLNFKFRYRHPKIKGLAFGVNGNFMYERSGRFFLWKNSDVDILRMQSGSDDKYYYFQIDPNLKYADKKGNKHSVNMRYYRKFRYGNAPDINTVANIFLLDYQYQRRFFKNMFTITTGATGTYGWVQSSIFLDSLQVDTSGQPKKHFTTYTGALFAQLEFSYKRLNLLGGVRFELSGADSMVVTSIPVFRAGINFKASKSTFLRLSWGQSYRVPSLAERFVGAEIFPGFSVIPNFDLMPESGWSAEIGVKQGFRIGKNWGALADFSIFWMEYTNMIQYNIGIWPPDTQPPSPQYLGFKPFNISQARIAGFELTLTGKGKIGPIEVLPQIGYTYTYPADLSSTPSQRDVGNFLNNMFSTFGQNLLSTPRDTLLLAFRNRHTFRGNLDLLWNNIGIGTTIYYSTFIEKIDPNLLYLEIAIPGFITPYIDSRADRNGDFMLDLRASYNIEKLHTKISFVVKNVTNLEYAGRPGMLSPLRSFNLRFDFSF